MPPIASVDIDLGQHELVEELLGVDARACVAQYVASVSTTTPLRNRADAMVRAIEQSRASGRFQVRSRTWRTSRLTTPSMVALIQGARPGIALTDPDRNAAIDAMRIAAEKRVDGILGNSRRQPYGHAALLVASGVAFAPKSRAAELLRWATHLRQLYWRRHAFREELARACKSQGVLGPA